MNFRGIQDIEITNTIGVDRGEYIKVSISPRVVEVYDAENFYSISGQFNLELSRVECLLLIYNMICSAYGRDVAERFVAARSEQGFADYTTDNYEF